jgi:serine kinase of HPr protein (carbohydrate metabolism regulator)
MILHAGLVALREGGLWRGALILGPSGAGKSDLALRALESGFRLVADDRVSVWASGGALYGRAPAPLAGLIEARGHGVTPEPAIGLAEIVLAVRCVEAGAAIERTPDPATETIADVTVPLSFLDAREPSAPAKLRRALQHLGAAAQQAYLPTSRGGGDRAGTWGYPLRPRL